MTLVETSVINPEYREDAVPRTSGSMEIQTEFLTQKEIAVALKIAKTAERRQTSVKTETREYTEAVMAGAYHDIEGLPRESQTRVVEGVFKVLDLQYPELPLSKKTDLIEAAVDKLNDVHNDRRDAPVLEQLHVAERTLELVQQKTDIQDAKLRVLPAEIRKQIEAAIESHPELSDELTQLSSRLTSIVYSSRAPIEEEVAADVQSTEVAEIAQPKKSLFHAPFAFAKKLLAERGIQRPESSQA